MAKNTSELLALQDSSYKVEVTPKAWERQNYEPHFWFQIFSRYYLTLGLTRTLQKAFRDFLKEKFEREIEDDEWKSPPKMWLEAYTEWEWEDRAILWDEDQTFQRNLMWAERQNELREKEWQVSNQLLVLATQTLDAWMIKFNKAIQERGKAPELRFVDIERAVNIASRIGRLSAGLATENTNITADLTVKARDIESVRKKRWTIHKSALKELDDDPTIIEGEIVG